jgi:hypothetical protein
MFALILLLSLAAPCHLKADDWRPVSPEDLALKDNPKQPGADAMVLYRQVDVDAKNASVNNYFQIKIFTTAGVRAQSDVELPYDKAQESIQGVRARTIQADGTITDFSGQSFDKEIVKGHGIKYLAIKTWLPLGATFEATSIVNWDDVEKPLHVEGAFTIPSSTAASYQRLLLPLEIFQATEFSSFQSQKRTNAIYFSYPYEKTDDIVIHAPLGYTVQSLPPVQNLNRGAVVYEISAVNQSSGIEVKRHLLVNGVLYGKESYPTLRAFFSTVKTDDGAQALLQTSATARNN